MLTAAVCGEPTVDGVLEAIRTVKGDAGCLLIINNFIEDRLNFGLAAEKAKALFGKKVKTIVVDDNVDLPENSDEAIVDNNINNLPNV